MKSRKNGAKRIAGRRKAVRKEKTKRESNSAFFALFYHVFRAKSPKSVSFFDFFFVFPFFFLYLGLSLETGFLPFGRNVHISLIGICCENEAALLKKAPPETTAALRIDG